MLDIRGDCNHAVCYTDELEPAAEQQVRELCRWEAFRSCRIRIMPDVHAGAGCTIGTTMTVHDKVAPAMVGVDIGCGMRTVKLGREAPDFLWLDRLIRSEIPAGRAVRQTAHPAAANFPLEELRCADSVSLEHARRSLGTLGGGNHFIEVDRNPHGEFFLIIHTGSRHLGCEVAEYYMRRGLEQLRGNLKAHIREMVALYRQSGRQSELESTLSAFRAQEENCIPKELAYVQGALLEDYLHDMQLVQRFADCNRRLIAEAILQGMELTEEDSFTTVHNYIDTEQMILRKGAVSARKGERLLIPVNMRDGSLLCVGKGNEEWNYSAPHGAGRVMSRNTARRSLSLAQYAEQMDGVFSTCIGSDTLDEAPMAYRSAEYLCRSIAPTAEVIDRLLPVYNFKAME